MSKTKKNPKVDQYYIVGCGRCPLGETPDCKAKKWLKVFKLLRTILLSCGLEEEVKWGVPCYMVEKQNVLVMSGFKEYCSISFFKGSLMKDPKGILYQPSENSQAARLIKFTEVEQVIELESTLREYILEAIEIEKSGLKVDFKAKTELVYPEELLLQFTRHPPLQSAFEALTPGRQRGYILHFTAPKQSQTKTTRIEKCIPRILDGLGMQD